MRKVIRTLTNTTRNSANTNYLLFPRTTSTAVVCSAGRWPVANGNSCGNDRGGAPEMLKALKRWFIGSHNTTSTAELVFRQRPTQSHLWGILFKQRNSTKLPNLYRFMNFRLLPQLNKCYVSYSLPFAVDCNYIC